MPSGARHATLLAALLCLALAIPAAAAERPPQLVAQIAQATPEAGPGEQPELSDEPPTALDGDSGEDTGDETRTPAPRSPARRPKALAETGSEAGMLALAGFALLGWGVALRLRLRDAA